MIIARDIFLSSSVSAVSSAVSSRRVAFGMDDADDADDANDANDANRVPRFTTLDRTRRRSDPIDRIEFLRMGRGRGFGFGSGGKSSSSSSRPSSPAYTYQVNFSGGKRYIGMAHTKTTLKKRIATQLSGGPGASAVCKNNRAHSVSGVFKHKSVTAAKAAETKRYHSTKAALGADKVRGAGHTKDFKK